jgi:integrase
MPEEARVLARVKLGETARGIDVAQLKKNQRHKLAAETFEGVAQRYLSERGKNNKSWPETRRLLEHDAIPVLASKPMAAITRGDIMALIDRTERRAPAVARALFAQLRPLFKWALDRQIIESNPIAGAKAPRAPSNRERTLDGNELRACWRGTASLGFPFSPIYRLLLLTGQRREEVAGMRWDEIDLEKGIWRLPSKGEFQPQRTKNGKEHVIDLSPQALAILEALRTEPRGLVFITTGKKPASFAKSLLLKRHAFRHESEIRLLFLGDPKDYLDGRYGYKVDPHDLVTQIMADPNRDRKYWLRDQEAIRKATNFVHEIKRSKIYDPPEWDSAIYHSATAVMTRSQSPSRWRSNRWMERFSLHLYAPLSPGQAGKSHSCWKRPCPQSRELRNYIKDQKPSPRRARRGSRAGHTH